MWELTLAEACHLSDVSLHLVKFALVDVGGDHVIGTCAALNTTGPRLAINSTWGGVAYVLRLEGAGQLV